MDYMYMSVDYSVDCSSCFLLQRGGQIYTLCPTIDTFIPKLHEVLNYTVYGPTGDWFSASRGTFHLQFLFHLLAVVLSDSFYVVCIDRLVTCRYIL